MMMMMMKQKKKEQNGGVRFEIMSLWARSSPRQGPTVRYVRRRWWGLIHFHTTSSWIWPEQMFVLSGIKHRTVHSIVAVRLVYAERRAAMPPCWLKRSISPRTHNHTIHSHGWVNKNVKTFTSVTYVNLGTRPQPLVGSKMDLMAKTDTYITNGLFFNLTLLC